MCSSRDADKAQEVAAKLPQVDGSKHFGVVLDHCDPASLEAGFSAAVAAAGKVDILVNNGLEGIPTAQNQKLDIASTAFEAFAQHQANHRAQGRGLIAADR